MRGNRETNRKNTGTAGEGRDADLGLGHDKPGEAEEQDVVDIDEDEQFAEWFRELLAVQRRAPERRHPYVTDPIRDEDIKEGLRMMRSLTPEELEEEGPAVAKLIERARKMGWKPGKPDAG